MDNEIGELLLTTIKITNYINTVVATLIGQVILLCYSKVTLNNLFSLPLWIGSILAIDTLTVTSLHAS